MKITTTRHWIAGVLVTLASITDISAQIVNTEKQIAATPEEGTSGSVSGQWERKSGNSDYSTISFSAAVHHSFDQHTVSLLGNYKRGKQRDTVFLQNSFIHLRDRYRLSDSMSWETFLQRSHDKFRLWKSRDLLGSGPRLTLLRTPDWQAHWGAAIMAEQETFTDSDKTNNTTRMSTYLSLQAKISEQATYQTITYFQPELTKVDNRRLSHESTLAFAVSEDLSFTASLVVVYDSNPPETVEKQDLSVTNGLTVTF